MSKLLAHRALLFVSLLLTAEVSRSYDASFVTRSDTVHLQADSSRLVIAIADSAPEAFLDTLLSQLGGTVRASSYSLDDHIASLDIDAGEVSVDPSRGACTTFNYLRADA